MKCIVHVITGLGDGGAEAVLFRLINNDKAFKHVVVSLTDGGKYRELLALRGVPVYELGISSERFMIGGFWKLFKIIRKIKPDAMQTWMYHSDLIGGVVGRLAGCRNVIWGIHCTTLDTKAVGHRTNYIVKLCSKLSGIIPKHIIYCAEKACEIHLSKGYSAKNFSVVPNGYDVTVFKPSTDAGSTIRRELRLNDEDDVIGYIARFHPQKDHENILKALSILRDRGKCPKCILVGTDVNFENKTLLSRIEFYNLEGCVKLLGSRNDIPDILNAIDIHVMSSAFGEAFPNVLAEAMACGVPCVSTNVGDAAIILGGIGRIVPPRDSKALADAMDEMINLKYSDHWSENCLNARARIVENFSIEKMVEKYSSVWFEEIR